MMLSAVRRPLAAMAVVATLLAGCSATGATPTVASSTAPGGAADCPTQPPPPLSAGETRTVTLETAKGSIVTKVEADLGPLAAGNFVALAGCGFYDGVIFHRLVPGFVIQGGDPTGTGAGDPGYEFANDPVTIAYDRGVVAMANGGVDTNGSQFFIVLQSNSLAPDYSIFGRVTSGMETVDAIAAMPNSGPPENRALEPVSMTRVRVANP